MNKCLWCGNKSKINLSMTFKDIQGSRHTYSVCCQKCRENIKNYFEFIKNYIKFYILFLLISIIVGTSIIISGKMALGIFILFWSTGLLIVLFPLTNIETARILSVKKCIFLNRIVGIIFLILGYLILL